MPRRFLLIFSLFLFLFAGRAALAYSNPGVPAGFVNDYAKIFKPAEKDALENKLSQFNASSSNEVAVVAITSLDGDTIENFANKLFDDWKIGKEKKDNGVLLLIAVNDRKMRIEPGYGLEGALPDAICNQIINKTMKPAFQAEKYYDGVDQATDEIIAATKGEYTPDSSNLPSAPGFLKNLNFDAVFWIILLIFYAISALRRYLAKTASWWEGGVIGAIFGFIIALFFSGLAILALWLFPLVFAILGLIFDYLVSRILPKPNKTRRGGPWFFGGFGGGSGLGGSGGGFGGFGGGGSGGGGSSGSW